MPTLVFLGDVHNLDNAITTSMANSGIVIANQTTYALLLEDPMDSIGDAPISPYEYAQAINLICNCKSNDAADRTILLELMNGSNNNVYSFDADGQEQGSARQNAQRNNIVLPIVIGMPDEYKKII